MHRDVWHAMAQAGKLGGNPASLHGPGRAARDIVERAQRTLVALGPPSLTQALFVASEAEAATLCAAGLAWGESARKNAVCLSPGVLATSPHLPTVLGRMGHDVVPLRSASVGGPMQQEIASHLGAQTRSVCVTAAELPQQNRAAAALAAGCRDFCVALFVAAAPDLQTLRLLGQQLPVAAMSLASSFLGGPPGIVGLLLAQSATVQPLWGGGAQFMGQRPGTEAVALLAGFDQALRRSI